MKADIIREKYLKFFEGKGHKIVASDSLVPKDDPTLLFTGAGMNQFKEYFLGIKKGFKRAATSQKCFRTGDIDNVGKTASHHTFFEMLGNFSFGDYFKKEAVQWAWEFMTRELGILGEKLWVSVYKDDDEAYDLWLNVVKVPENRIVKLGDKDNFWPSQSKQKGPNGPCGPCSEIFFDQGEIIGCGKKDCTPACGCARFIEVWNLVFTQFNRKEGGVLEPLPMKNIDTGMGLERIAAVMQGVRSNFETDLFKPIVEAIVSLCHSEEQSDEESKERSLPAAGRLRFTQDDNIVIHTIADHIRAAVFLIADGVMPSNEGRGYVERMIIRRAVRFGKKLGIEGVFLYKLVPAVSEIMKEQYPELLRRRENISQVILNEEEKFSQTLEEGTQILEGLMKNAELKEISGDAIFKLYDTYGFPYDLTEEIAREKGFKLDKPGFDKALKAQRDLSKKSSAIGGEIFAITTAHKIKKIASGTKFIGYENLSCEAEVVVILKNEEPVKEAKEKDKVWIILDRTSFYGSSGGQMGDTGKIISQKSKEEAVLDVIDAKNFDNVIVHICDVKKGLIKTGDKVKAEVDSQRRLDIAKNHTATHLLQAVLRKVLGSHVHQSGSLVAPDRLRFDFTHFKALTDEQIERIENLVNEKIREGLKVSVRTMDLKEATASGAMALFGETYDDNVRVVSVGDYSKELCGGTHLDDVSLIGVFKIIRESSISAGTRRIEAVTGRFTAMAAIKQEEIIKEVMKLLNVPQKNIIEGIQTLQDKLNKLESSLARRRKQMSAQQADELIKNCKKIKDIKVITAQINDVDMDILKSMADMIRSKTDSAAILLVSCDADKIFIVISFSKDLVKRGFDAGRAIKDISKIASGGGGGRPDMAVGGGKDPSKIKDLFKKFEQSLVPRR